VIGPARVGGGGDGQMRQQKRVGGGGEGEGDAAPGSGFERTPVASP